MIFILKVNDSFLSFLVKYDYLYNFSEIINSVTEIISSEINDNKMYYYLLEISKNNKILYIYTFLTIKEIDL